MKKMDKNKKIILAVIVAIIIIAIIMFLAMRNTKETTYTITLQNEQQIFTLETDKNGMLEEPEEPTKEGYVFLGWYIKNEKVDFSKPFTGDTNIVAKWGILEEPQEDVQQPEQQEPEVQEPETQEPEKEEEGSQKQEQTNNKPQTQKPVVQKPQKPEAEKPEQKPETEKPTPEQPEEKPEPEKPTPEQPEQKPEDPTPEKPEEEKPQPEEPKPVEVTSIKLSATTLNLEVGQNSTLTATVNPSNATNKTVTWTSSNKSVATVDSNGKVTAVGAGTATITATAGGKSVSCTVTVKNKVTYSVQWVKLDGSAIEQYKLYIISSEGKYVNGTLEITTIAGKTFEEEVTTNGSANAYIKSAIKSVKIKNIK